MIRRQALRARSSTSYGNGIDRRGPTGPCEPDRGKQKNGNEAKSQFPRRDSIGLDQSLANGFGPFASCRNIVPIASLRYRLLSNRSCRFRLARGLTDYRGQLRLWDSATVQVGDGLVGNTVSAAFGTDRISRLKGGRRTGLRYGYEAGIDAERGSEARRQIDDGRLVFD